MTGVQTCALPICFPVTIGVELLEQLIKDSTNEGDTVLDCFMGSGSTMEACANTGAGGAGGGGCLVVITYF